MAPDRLKLKTLNDNPYNNRWCLVGREDSLKDRHRLVVLHIDRISDVRMSEGVEFRVEGNYQIERHFKHNVGVSL